MATVAQTLTSLDNVRHAVRARPTTYHYADTPEPVVVRWETLDTRLATLQDDGGTVADAQAAVAVLKDSRKRPTVYKFKWDVAGAAIAALADAA